MRNDSFRATACLVHERAAPIADDGDTTDERTTRLVADGGIEWRDLTAFQRDILEAVAALEADDETSYGLTIEQRLETEYTELNDAHLYPILDSLACRGLLTKSGLDSMSSDDFVSTSELDRRTSEYQLSESGRTLLENRARRLAENCGIVSTEP